MKPRVYIIILNWNGKDLTIDCLQSLSKVNYNNFKILVIDNNSQDDSVAEINKSFPEIEMLELDKNYGYAGGNNRGFESIEENTEYVIFLNNDTIVDKDFIDPLIDVLKNDNTVGQTVPKILYANSIAKIWYAGGRVNHWIGSIKHVGIRQTDSEKFNVSNSTDYATGCCFAMRYKDFKEIGGFDPAYPMYCEDVDLSIRIRQVGYDVLYVPDSIIYHKISSSVGGELSLNKLRRKILAYIKLFGRYSNIFQKISIPISWLIAIPLYLIKYIYLLIIKND